MLAHPDFACGFHFLGDYRRLARGPGPTHVRALAREVRDRARLFAPCRWALVLPPAYGGAAGLLNTLAAGSWVEFGAFASPGAATRWLDAGTAEWLALQHGSPEGGLT